ncbi:MAG TPA: lipid-A-disaccharide synthase [Burkholderiaceae bacterium]|nr:lipid-A-disaccharide synthase [Burkholderiaceae bacterium]
MVAGEASGDLLAAHMLSALRPALPQATMHGIGGSHMAEHGFVSDWPLEKMTVRGLFEIIPRYRELKRIQTTLRDQLLIERPAAFIGVDYPGFNLGLEEQLRAAGIPTMHFIGPQIWAWRGWRIKKIMRAVSHMLVIFPFEEAIYQAAGVPATYIGHPLAQVIPMEIDVAGARSKLNLPVQGKGPVVAVLPGSRMSELKYNSAAFIGAVQILNQRDASIRFVAPMAGATQRAYFADAIAAAGLQNLPIQLVDGQSHAAMAAADAVLVASGTASLEVALHKKPMVIAYKMMAASWHIMRHMGYQPWIGLPNILAREFLVPELLQDAATPKALADAIWQQLQDVNHRAALEQRFIDMHHSLRRDTARESAQAVLKLIGRGATS